MHNEQAGSVQTCFVWVWIFFAVGVLFCLFPNLQSEEKQKSKNGKYLKVWCFQNFICMWNVQKWDKNKAILLNGEPSGFNASN